MKGKCKIWFCEEPKYAKGYCRAHYTNLGRFGMPIAPSNKDVISLIVALQELNLLKVAVDDSTDGIIDGTTDLYNIIVSYRTEKKK